MKTTFSKWMAVVGGACLATAIVHPRLARSADHMDAPATKAEPPADINDVYAFMDGNNAVFAMTVFPAAPAGARFSDTVQYVLHTQSAAAFGGGASDVNVICTFDAAQTAQCWAGGEYATGNASTEAGIASASGRLKVFAGLRADPFFFNLTAFQETAKTVKAAVDGGGGTPLAFDSTGCPRLDAPTSQALVKLLATNPDGGGAPVDFFATLNTLAIVASLDKALVTAGGPIVSVWGSTNRKP